MREGAWHIQPKSHQLCQSADHAQQALCCFESKQGTRAYWELNTTVETATVGCMCLQVGAHDGDWEHVTVRLSADASRVLGVYYSAHRCAQSPALTTVLKFKSLVRLCCPERMLRLCAGISQRMQQAKS